KSFVQGAFTQAIQHWQTALEQTEPKAPEYVEILIHLAKAYQATGRYERAFHILQSAFRAAEDNGTSEQQALILSYLGELSLVMQRPEKAETYIEDGIARVRTQSAPLLSAHLFNNLANVLAVQKRYSEALENYLESARLARQDVILRVRALANQARLHVRQGDGAAAMRILKQALAYLKQQPDNRGNELLALGQLFLYSKAHFPQIKSENFAVQTLA
ncbi:MAG: tetratricopeptide repeat protein, partial [Gammaproteobacteria bacterium]|nr:tetratricopeptide repeat protein [Gammaproteobacteria bacterium]